VNDEQDSGSIKAGTFLTCWSINCSRNTLYHRIRYKLQKLGSKGWNNILFLIDLFATTVLNIPFRHM